MKMKVFVKKKSDIMTIITNLFNTNIAVITIVNKIISHKL